MKPSLSFLIVILFTCQKASLAQSSNDKLKYGIKAGINTTTYGMNSQRKQDMKEEGFKLKPSFSFHLGGFADYSLTQAISLQAGLTLSGKGLKETWSGEDDFDGSLYEGQYKERLLYLELPINFVYKWSQFQIGAGPYVGYALSGQWKENFTEDINGTIESDVESGKIKFSGENAWRKRIDFGINISGGYRLTDNINLEAGYGLGLSNIYKNDNPENLKYWSQKNRVFSISVSYLF